MFIEKFSSESPSVIALGNFDGLHSGHRLVLKKTLDEAEKKGFTPLVLLFDEHPKKLLSGNRPPMLMTDEMKEEKLKSEGFKLVKVSFGKTKDLTPYDFLKLIQKELNVCEICCGYNYRYGKNASGNVETLENDCRELGIELFVSEEMDFENEPVSSTRIRKAIEDGDMEKANGMLGREFSYCFEVVSGDRRGRLLGFPTINQFFPEDFVRPLSGVYASKVNINGKWYPAVTNIGIRPTIGTDSFRSETCILGFSGDLYGQFIEVFLLKHTRPEQKFEDLDELSARIKKDAETAEEVFNRKEASLKMTEKLNVKAVFFDFDDTLQSRKGAYRIYCENFLTKYFPSISGEEREKKLDEMEEYVDGGYKDREVYFPEIIELWGWDNHPPMQELYDSFNYDYGKNVDMLPGAIDVLKEIKNRGYILGAITNGVSSLQNLKLDTAGIRDLFDVVVVSGDIGIYKPDRRIFDEAIRRAGVKNEESLFVGDHPVNDIQGALGADMQAIRMNYGDFKGKGLGQKGVAAEIEDIRQVLEFV